MPTTVVHQFLEVFPRPFVLTLHGVFSLAYAEAERQMAQFDGPEAHDLRPILRRALIEQAMRAHARAHDLDAYARPNEISNCYHSYIERAPFSLTESAVTSPGEMVRRSVFREDYSYRNAQLQMWDDAAPQSVEKMYGIVLHGPHPKDLRRPGFTWIRFPFPGFERYLPERLDLERLAGSSAVPDVPQDEIEDRVEMEITRYLQRKDEGRGG